MFSLNLCIKGCLVSTLNVTQQLPFNTYVYTYMYILCTYVCIKICFLVTITCVSEGEK